MDRLHSPRWRQHNKTPPPGYGVGGYLQYSGICDCHYNCPSGVYVGITKVISVEIPQWRLAAKRLDTLTVDFRSEHLHYALLLSSACRTGKFVYLNAALPKT